LDKNDFIKIIKKPVQYLKGVGEARAALFHRLNIFTVGDAVNYYPREYEDRSRLKKIIELSDGDECSFEGFIASKVLETRPRKGLLISKVSIRDDTGIINAIWFNRNYLKRTFNIGDKYVFYGKIVKRRSYEVQNPVFEKADTGVMKNTCRIIPIYPATNNLSQNVIRSVIRSSLELVSGMIPEVLPDWMLNKYGLKDINYSIKNIHFPESDADFKNARYRLVFEELMLLQLGLLKIKSFVEDMAKGIKFNGKEEVEEFIEGLPFRLTTAQKKVLSEIEKDMESEKVMNRLVQGDVGSGKTIVAVISLVKAVKSGYQGAFMVPTEILAEQHFRSVKELLEGFDIRADLLTGSLPRKEKEKILCDIKNGRVDVVIGTHALIEEKVVFQRLGLVITDEQHRFGVRQRAALTISSTSSLSIRHFPERGILILFSTRSSKTSKIDSISICVPP
jgi:ATP-dependent DNA helicase RecG